MKKLICLIIGHKWYLARGKRMQVCDRCGKFIRLKPLSHKDILGI